MQTEPSASKKAPNPLTNDILAAFVMIRQKASLAAVQKPQHFIKVFFNICWVWVWVWGWVFKYYIDISSF